MKRIVLILAPEKFHDDEYTITREVIEKSKIEVEVASLNVNRATGYKKLEVNIDLNIADIDHHSYDGIVVVGGFGVKNHLWDNEQLHKVIAKFYESKKLLAAICLAPVCFANAGILKDVKACVYKNKHALQAFNAQDVNYQLEQVVIDENIITANGPKASQKFGQAIVEKLLESKR